MQCFLDLCTRQKGAFPALDEDREPNAGNLAGTKRWFVTTKHRCIRLEWLSPCGRLHRSPVVLTEAAGSRKQRELGAPSTARCARYLVSLWGSRSMWALQAPRYKAWLVSLCRCFSDKRGESYAFPADFSRVKSESLREEKQQQQSHLLSAFT